MSSETKQKPFPIVHIDIGEPEPEPPRPAPSNSRDGAVAVATGIFSISATEMIARRQLSRLTRLVFAKIDDLTVLLDVPTYPGRTAKRVFMTVTEHGFQAGFSKSNAIAAACLHIGCRQECVARTCKEILAVTNVTRNQLSFFMQVILDILENCHPMPHPENIIPSLCLGLGFGFSSRLEDAAMAIALKVVKLRIADGRSAPAIAAASIYMASQASTRKRTKQEIAVVAGVSQDVIRSIYKLMYERVREVFPIDYIPFSPMLRLPVE